MKPRLVVLISGSGTNLQAIIDAIQAQHLNAEIKLVVSNRKKAYGLTRAQDAQIPTLYWPLKPYSDAGRPREEYDAALAQQIIPYQPDLIVLAGWMHILSPAFLDVFPQRIINLHPALPGQFAGIDAITRTYEAYQQGEVPQGGCMVHYAISEVDAGAVLVTREVPIYPHDTLEDFEQRLHTAEHEALVTAIQQFFGQ